MKSWILNLFEIGRKRDLEENDLYTTLKDHTASSLGDKLEKKWGLEIVKAKNNNRKPSLLRALVQTFGAEYMFYGFIRFIDVNFFRISQPLLIGGLLSYFNTEDIRKTEIHYAYKCASGLLLTNLISTVLLHYVKIETKLCGMKMRIACCSLIYRKVLKLSHKAIGETTNGRVVNLITNDVGQIDEALIDSHYIWVGPLQTIIVTYLLWQEIGVSSLVGIFILICFIPLQGWLGKINSNIRQKTANKTDERLRLINEIISGIQVIKMYTWEKPFSKLIRNIRKREMTLIKESSFIKVILLSIMLVQTKLEIFASIFAYIILGNFITVQKVFVVTSLYNLLYTSMTIYFSLSIAQIAELLVCVKRIQEFLLLEEKESQTPKLSKSLQKIVNVNIQLNNENFTKNKTEMTHDIAHLNDFGIEILNATAKWTEDQTTNSLENINLVVYPGRLAAIIGPVGSGKSSLIQLILRELPLIEGTINVRGIVSYASQQPWIFAGSIQQNIIFDSPKDEKRYTEVIKMCALKSDFDRLPHGDKTIVGERGISLSGGQKARISLARCVYKKADIYLLDDPLSAVDTHVGKHLFKKCIKDYLKEKTCILITHQVQYVTKADQIVLMDNAKITAQGTYQEIRASCNDIAKLIESLEGIKERNDSDIEVFGQNNKILASKQNLSLINLNDKSLSTSIGRKVSGTKENLINVAECQSSGQIPKNIFISYFAAVGSTSKVVILISSFIITQVLVTGVELWLSFWLYQEEYVLRNSNSTSVGSSTNMTCEVFDFISLSLFCQRQTYIIVYAVLVVFLMITCIIRSMIFVSVVTKASINLHSGMFNTIIRATMYFFNTNSSGQILNCFSNDIGAIDGILPSYKFEVLQIFMLTLGIILVAVFINIYLIIPTILFGLVLYLIRCYYLPTSQNIKRLEAVTRSPILSHMNESLYGLTTIRAYGADKIVTEQFDSHQDLHTSAWYLFISSNHAFGFWLDFCSFSYISIVIFSFLLVDNNTYGGNVGLVITQIMVLSGMIQWGIRLMTMLENQLTSVERVLEYTNAPQEQNNESSSVKIPPKNWPISGKIIFKNVHLRYCLDSSYVLENLDFQIKPMEKIGIVGRTGAGKSSIIRALFRLALNEGKIIIDGIEIHELNLHALRSKLSIIPQEPFLFSGTMRKNLDPFDEYSDCVLWNALEEVELKLVIENLPGGLNSKISENGLNLSVGQRQLVCLARAIVRNRKILILDEATANVDPQTDALIQNTIRDKFRSCTVLTIAHRLNTIMDSDKILVMDSGSMVEFGHPYSLLQNKNGFLFSMVAQSGQATADLLRRVAAESFEAMQVNQ